MPVRGVRGCAVSFPIRIRPSCYSLSPHARFQSEAATGVRGAGVRPGVVPALTPLPCGSDLPLSSPSRAQAISPTLSRGHSPLKVYPRRISPDPHP